MRLDVADLMFQIRERIRLLIRGKTRYLHPDDQARLSWARTVPSEAELPESYRSFFSALPAGDKTPFPYSVIGPTFQGYLQPENEKMISHIGGDLCVLEPREDRLDILRYPISGIYFLETGSILLHSWFTVCGTDSSGRLASSTFRFNSVTEHMFAPFVETFRSATAEGGAERAEADTSMFTPLADVNFKFMNFARKSIRPGDSVLQYLFQPEIRRTLFSFLGYSFTRRAAAAHITILTRTELICIRDDPTQRADARKPYGGIWTYIPRRHMEGAAFDLETNELVIRLPKQQRKRMRFEAGKKHEVEQLLRRLESGA